jgi:UPF0271 protein
MGRRRTIDLNADVGEAGDGDGIRTERELLALVSSAHVACGGHAGDAASMRDTVLAALAHGVRVGAHPSYPDRAGFGRRPMELRSAALTAALGDQLQAMVDVCRTLGTRVASVKPHGALYGEVGTGGIAYAALLEAVRTTCEPDVALVLRSGCTAVELARASGMAVEEEGFCDRAYTPQGELVDRQVPGAVLGDPTAVAHQAALLARDGQVATVDGAVLSLRIDTLCIHGDTPGALAMANAVCGAMWESGIEVAAPPGHP